MSEPTLRERFDELRERLFAVIDQVDLRAQIEAHPWELVGTAALLGAWLGFEPPRIKLREQATWGERARGVLLSAVGALALRAIREAALRQVVGVAKRWWDESAGAPPPGVDHPAPVTPPA